VLTRLRIEFLPPKSSKQLEEAFQEQMVRDCTGNYSGLVHIQSEKGRGWGEDGSWSNTVSI
jgi:hypothetical protein